MHNLPIIRCFMCNYINTILCIASLLLITHSIMSSINDLLKKFKNRDGKGSLNPNNKKDVQQEKIKLFNNFKKTNEHICQSKSKSDNIEISTSSVGILIMIIDDFPHEKIWRKWLDTTNNSNISTSISNINSINSINSNDSIKILIHAKNPENVTSKWVKERLVKTFQYKPQWGSSDLTRVMIGLMKEVRCEEYILIYILYIHVLIYQVVNTTTNMYQYE